MQPNQLQAQATQAAQQGQQQYQSDIDQSNQFKQQFGQYQNQANTAQQNLSDYTKYMQGAGSGTNLYNTGLQQGFHDTGYDPGAAAAAAQNLMRSQNALGGLQQASQSSTGGYGLSGAQLGNFYASQAQPLSNQIGAQSNAVGALQKAYEDSLTNANQYAGQGLQGEQITAGALTQTFQNAKSQSDQAQQQMQFYADLAKQQGGMNAQNAAGYAQALNAYKQGQAAMAQAGYLIAQTKQQEMQNQQTQAYMGSPAYQNYLKSGSTAGATAQPANKTSASARPDQYLSPSNMASTIGNTNWGSDIAQWGKNIINSPITPFAAAPLSPALAAASGVKQLLGKIF